MANRRGVTALAGAVAGVAAGIVAERTALNRRRKHDPEASEPFGRRRGSRSGRIGLPDGAEIFYEETGPQGPKGAVFVHGSALRTDLWHYQIGGLGDHRLIFYDLRGHGLSTRGEAKFSIPTLADDLSHVIRDRGLREVVVVGHSIGGMVALDACHRHPDLVGDVIKGLVLSNTTHRPAVETLAGGAALSRVERVARRPLDFLGSQSQRIDYLRRIIKPSDALFWAVSFSAFGPGASAKQVDFSYDMLAETSAETIFELVRSYRDFDVTEVLGDITVPTLVIAGTQDRITVSRASEFLAESLPKSELHLLPGCGHMAMLERHGEFNALVERFLDDTLGREGEEGT